MLLISAIYSDYVRCRRLVPLTSRGKMVCLGEKVCHVYYSFINFFISMSATDGTAMFMLCHKQKTCWDKSSTPQYCLNIVCLNSTIHLTTSTSNLLYFCITHQETNQVQGQYNITHPAVKKYFRLSPTECVCVIEMCSVTFCCLYGWCVKANYHFINGLL